MRIRFLIIVVICLCAVQCMAKKSLPLIQPSKDGSHFVRTDTNSPFIIWGFNYDHDNDGLIAGCEWKKHWPAVVEDFKIMKSLGANTIRLHLSTMKYMPKVSEPNQTALHELTDILKLAEKMNMYLDITGLACYRKEKVPQWYRDANESLRWSVQANFWEAIAKICKDSPAVIFYDLMNEPLIPAKAEKDMLVGEGFAGRFYVQNITLDPAGRTQQEIIESWLKTLTAAIKKYDKKRMITVGEIPWSQIWPNWKSSFHSGQAGRYLDFAAIHMYPKTNEITKALDALNAYPAGKPILIEEGFPLNCSSEDMETYMNKTKNFTAGWISFFWRDRDPNSNAVVLDWAQRFQKIRSKIVEPNTL